MRLKIINSLLLLALLLPLSGCGQSAAEKAAAEPATLKVWSVFEDQTAFENLMNSYQKVHSNISFDFKILRFDEYEDELLQAFARGEGPDIFALHNTWLGEYQELISPLPKSLSIPYTEIKGTLKKETIVTLKEEKALTTSEMKNNFVDVVYDDMVLPYQSESDKEPEDKIFAIPLSVDTMVLYSNTELLNTANIAEPPTNWQEFQDQVKLLTKLDANGKITQSAAAIGSGENVERATDMLAVLMMQNNTAMESDDRAIFAAMSSDRRSPAAEALRFYTDFANPVKEVYTWNKDMNNSFDAFVNGKTAFLFGYAYHQPLIQQKAKKLEFKLSPLPQIEGGKTVNFANYWAWTVAKASANNKWSWDFIQFAAREENVKTYLETANRPTALRGLINEQAEDAELGVFAGQLLTAESWYHGQDAGVAEAAFVSLIDTALTSEFEFEDLVKDAQNKVNQTYQ